MFPFRTESLSAIASNERPKGIFVGPLVNIAAAPVCHANAKPVLEDGRQLRHRLFRRIGDFLWFSPGNGRATFNDQNGVPSAVREIVRIARAARVFKWGAF